MKLILILPFALTLLFSCKSQRKEELYSLDKEKMKRANDLSQWEIQLFVYVDSINAAYADEKLPLFLGDSQFDYSHSGLWPSFHTPISIRAQIINRITNCKALSIIINSSNPNFKKKPHIEADQTIPLMELSFYDLAYKRAEELNCK